MIEKTFEPLSQEETVILQIALETSDIEFTYDEAMSLYKDGIISEEAANGLVAGKADTKTIMTKEVQWEMTMKLARLCNDPLMKEYDVMMSKASGIKDRLYTNYTSVRKTHIAAAKKKSNNVAANKALGNL